MKGIIASNPENLLNRKGRKGREGIQKLNNMI
jgi:hypothetical protein